MTTRNGDDGLLLPFAVQNGELTHVSKVSRDDRSGYLCPQCGQRVVPRLGLERRHHFAHLTDTDCHGALETALHLVAKEILSRSEVFMVPDAVLEWNGHRHVVSKAQYIRYSDVHTEKSLGGIRPDAALIRPGKPNPLLVEVLVTHKADEVKLRRLKAMGYPCVEVDVSSALSDNSFDPELLEQILLHDASPLLKRWICIPGEDRYVALLKEQVKEEDAARQRRLTPTPAGRRERREREERRARRAGRSKGSYPVLPHTNIPVPHENAFIFPRQQWQHVVFYRFIQRVVSRAAAETPGRQPIIEVGYAELWLHEHYAELISGRVTSESGSEHLVALAIVEYLDALAQMGYVEAQLMPEGLPHHHIYGVLHR